MRLTFGPLYAVEDLRKHPPSTLIALALLLACPVEAYPDPKRRNFYEIRGESTVYYVYVSPFHETLFLLACWKKLPAPEPRFALAAQAS